MRILLFLLFFTSLQSQSNYNRLQNLFIEWRKFENPTLLNGAPDYTKKGFIINEGIPLEIANIPLPVGVKVTTDLNYMELPILAKYNFGNEKVGGYLTAGPTMSYASSGRFRTAANFIIDLNVIDQEFDFDNLNISKFDVGASIGAGGTVKLGTTKLFMDARYTHGFNKLDNIPVIDLDFKNKNFSLTTGFLIPLNRNYSGQKA